MEYKRTGAAHALRYRHGVEIVDPRTIVSRADTVAFNDFVDGRLVCRTFGADGSDRTLPWPLQAVHPGGEEALSLDFRRLASVQPEYGYAAAPHLDANVLAGVHERFDRVAAPDFDAKRVRVLREDSLQSHLCDAAHPSSRRISSRGQST